MRATATDDELGPASASIRKDDTISSASNIEGKYVCASIIRYAPKKKANRHGTGIAMLNDGIYCIVTW